MVPDILASFVHQKSKSRRKTWFKAPSARFDMTEAFWYSPTLFSKKLVFPLQTTQINVKTQWIHCYIIQRGCAVSKTTMHKTKMLLAPDSISWIRTLAAISGKSNPLVCKHTVMRWVPSNQMDSEHYNACCSPEQPAHRNLSHYQHPYVLKQNQKIKSNCIKTYRIGGSFTRRRSATKLTYSLISFEFMPTRSQDRASQTNTLSMSTAAHTISFTLFSGSLFSNKLENDNRKYSFRLVQIAACSNIAPQDITSYTEQATIHLWNVETLLTDQLPAGSESIWTLGILFLVQKW